MLSKARLILAAALVMCACAAASAQNDLPKALLSVNPDDAAPAARKYYVDVTMDVPLGDAMHEQLGGASPPVIGVLAAKGKPVPDQGAFKNMFLIAPLDELEPADRAPLFKALFRMYVPEKIYLDPAHPEKLLDPFADFNALKLSVIITNYIGEDGGSVVRSVPVAKAVERELTTEFPTCRPGEVALTFPYDPQDPFSLKRAVKLHDYLNRRLRPRLGEVKIEVEPLTRDKVTTIGVKEMRLTPEATREVEARTLTINQTVAACFIPDRGLPTEKFDARLTLPSDAPADLLHPRVTAGLAGRSAEASPKVFVDKEKAVGVRPIEKDLNIGVSLISSVADEEQEDGPAIRRRNTIGTLDLRLGFFRDVERLTVKGVSEGEIRPMKVCGEVVEHKPATGADPESITIVGETFTLAPGLRLTGVRPGTQQCLHFKYVDAGGRLTETNTNPLPAGVPPDPPFAPRISGLEDPDVTAGTYSIFTPFYVDAKVSTGKIVKDTLSLNRVVLGTQEELRYYANNFRFPTYYRFIFQGNHASDRDFKQGEFKGTFMFRPVFGPLNHPFDPSNTRSVGRELCPRCKPPFKLIPIRYGFEFVPLVGAEFGRTYFRRRPAEAVTPSDTVKRVFFGFDSTVNPTPRLSLTAQEIFYVRGESKEDRYRNYFLGEAAYRLTDLFDSRAAHSIFFSWERGGQPPFDEADVNVLKFGYRLTATTIFSRF
ncbi:MAG TPA: hypothetical protein VD968_02395 [Pyrinomonadaceae bacterium]|nr:hypothetical protein [Pyrinomonadaceae bacterium]